MKELLRRILYLGRQSRFDDDLDAEVQFHIETRAGELEHSGLSRTAALVQARREFGSGARMREETRSAWQIRWLEDLIGDLRYAARAFRRNPAFALTAVACLALGIGANTTIFSIGTEVMFSEPSVRDAGSMVHFRIGGSSHIPMRNYRELVATRAFDAIAGENEEVEANWRDGGNSSKVYVVHVTGSFFGVTGFPLAIGRGIQPGETDAVVLMHSFWQRRLGGNSQVVGRKLVLDGRPYVVAGILPRDHRTVTGFGFAPDLYMPAPTENSVVALYARLPQGMSRQEARERMKVACAEMDRAAPPGDHKWSQSVEVNGIAGMERVRFLGLQTAAIFFGMLMVIVGLVLLIACANVASLLLARASSRSHEMAVRVAIGAGRGRILRQLLAESLLLSILGAGAGLAINVAITTMLSKIQLPLPIPLQFLIEPDWRLMAYASALAVLTCLAAGTLPALKATRAALAATLKQRDERRWSFRNVLVAGQLAVSIVLLSAGFLFLRNLFQASTSSLGFDTTHTIWSYMRLVPGSNSRPVVAAALDRLRALPGVESAAITRWVPLNGNVSNGLEVGTDVSQRKVHLMFKFHSVSADYFRTMQIPILQGREFQASDRAGGPAIGILNESMAERLFGKASPVGHTVRFDDRTVQIVGVARNSKHFMLTEDNQAAFYEPYRIEGRTDLHFLIRAAARPEPLLVAINATLAEVDTTAAIETKPMHRALTFALLPSRFGAAVLGSMGFLGLLLAAIGLYGVLLYSVSRRTREIGLRVALGASPRSILQMVMGHSAALLGAGLVTGTVLAVFAVRPLAMFLLPDLKAADPLNFILVGAVLSLVAGAATAAPALRALRVDPMVALRHE